MSKSVDVVLIRHAQSTWNAQGRFTGWSDPALTPGGIAEASKAAEIIRGMGYKFSHAYASRLQRAEHTARIILQGLHSFGVKVKQDWRINERHYGDLQGRYIEDMVGAVGEEQVHRWRRGYKDKARPMSRENPSHPVNDRRYDHVPRECLPDVESLEDTQQRVMAFWQDVIVPHIKAEDSVLVSAHGNVLRALLMSLTGMEEKEVETFEIPTGVPIVYRFDEKANPISWQFVEPSVAA